MEKDTADILEAINFIKDRMATKDDIAELNSRMATKDDVAEVRAEVSLLRADMTEGFASIRAELQTIRQRLNELETVIQNSAGFSKEIDYVIEQQGALIERVRAIEEHLNLRHEIAA